MRARTTRTRGFTLIELMITVAIIAVLAAVAYPMYTDQIRKGRRAEARAALMNLLQQQERYMTQNNTYLAFSAGAAPSGSFKDYSGQTASDSSHVLGARICPNIGSVTPTIRDCVQVFAQPKAGYSDPEVTEMAIDTQGRRACTGSDTSRCWK